MVAAHRVDESNWKKQTSGNWIGTHASHKGLMDVMEKVGTKKPEPAYLGQKEAVQPDQKREWLRMTAALNGLGRPQ